MHDQIINTLFFLISILGIIYLLFWRYKAYSIDAFRQDIFCIRDDLFDYAQKGNIDFNHPAYGTIRSLINGFIRFGHHISFFRLIIYSLLMRDIFIKNKDSFNVRWQNVTKELNPKVNRELNEYLLRVHFSVFKHLILNSPELIATILLPVILYALSKYFIVNLNKMLSKPNDNIDSLAYAYGNIK